ncbi:hypothetical protein [Candidatus Neomicrothrix sp.]|uniref:hypothetical protein n=1 Tax=Candidatus Neomicrothrix sp. TaxID=2719034 RepID=UPI001B494E28|nr:hypothetical protein [Candidatus Microthrix sp.]MBK6503967.1 hypothetical protein [Candidatus Microthrix sp.]MBK7019325.1 hypothetical protein [Candidatus Microthrix sp.]MBL0204295.1 hypothetical protein [Candidatus Microthrix sp.]MBP6134421.1 hypothetical protein [Candidatus Microthrix sp.]MBP7404005.1 hypothetical protein [Candidatus Microthrix sp.]
MSDEPLRPGALGPPPQPEPSVREAAIASSLTRFDELIVDGRLTEGNEPHSRSDGSMPSSAPVDELAQVRERRQARRSNSPRWLVAAVVALVVGIGGAVVAQSMGGSNPEAANTAAQAESAPVSDSAAQSGAQEKGALTEAQPTGLPAAQPPAPQGAQADTATFPTWLCRLVAPFRVSGCAENQP